MLKDNKIDEDNSVRQLQNVNVDFTPILPQPMLPNQQENIEKR